MDREPMIGGNDSSTAMEGEEEGQRRGTEYGVLLNSIRRAAGLTQAALSERSTVSRSTIQNLELGVVLNPHDTTHQLLLEALTPFIGAQAQAELIEAYHSAKRQAFAGVRLR